MAASVSQINIKFLTKGEGDVAQAFKRLRGETVRLNRDFDTLSRKAIRQVRDEFNRLGSGQRNSINAMQAQRNALNGLRNMADVTGLEFKQLTADIARLDKKMRIAATGATGFKGRLKGFAQGAGSVAAGGIFGGPEGAIGGLIGLKVGGPAGSVVGAAIGAQVGQLRKAAGGIAEFSAALALQRKALKLVIKDTEKFRKSQEFLLKTSRKLAIPQSIITRQFTALTASVVGAGKSVEDAEEVFAAIAAGIRGTGGNLEDMKAAMRATAQVFSKGKVSAEELRQQLGERLPGAFTLFADSMDKTPAELDKALEQGKVTLDDFMKFAKKLFATYGSNAEILASGPEAAGDRLKTSLEELNDDLGALLRPIGAQFQGLSEDIIKSFGGIVKAFRKSIDDLLLERELIQDLELGKVDSIGSFFRTEQARINTEAKDEAIKQIKNTVITQTDIDEAIKNYGFRLNRKAFEKKLQDTLGKTFGEVKGTLGFFEAARGENLFDVTTRIRRRMIANIARGNNTDAQGRDYDDPNFGTGPIVTPPSDPPKIEEDVRLSGLQQGAQEYFKTIKTMSEETSKAVTDAFKGMENALVNFITTGKLNFSEFVRSILTDMTKIFVRQQIMRPFTSLFQKNAMGNVYDAGNKISKFAYGGVINKPKLFPMANGIGLMGEAGPEAILPLQRGRGGKLGVIAQGGSTGNITVNVDASGSSAEGDNQISTELGNAIGAAIQAELVNQKRPGGLLA